MKRGETTHTIALTDQTFEWFENAKRIESMDNEESYTNDEFISIILTEYPKPKKKKN